MVGSGNDVPQEHHPLAAMIEHNHLMPLGMTISNDYIESGHNLGIAIQQLQLSPFVNGQEILLAVGTVATLVGVAGFFPALALNVILSFGEGGHQVSSPVQPGATARVVKVQMGKHHRTYILGGEAHAFQALQEPAWNQPKILFVLVYLF